MSYDVYVIIDGVTKKVGVTESPGSCALFVGTHEPTEYFDGGQREYPRALDPLIDGYQWLGTEQTGGEEA